MQRTATVSESPLVVAAGKLVAVGLSVVDSLMDVAPGSYLIAAGCLRFIADGPVARCSVTVVYLWLAVDCN